MGRRLRWLPPAEDPSALPHRVSWRTSKDRVTVEITASTVRNLYLLRPSPRLREITIGILAKAQKQSGVEIHAFCFLSTHYHAICSFTDVHQMVRFMTFVQTNLSKEVCRLTGWTDRVWARPYRSTILSQEREVIGQRLRYLLSQGCKEGLVASPCEWPGASSVNPIARGEKTMCGIWVDRTALTNARKKRGHRDAGEHQFTSKEVLRLSSPSCLGQWEEYRQWTREMIELIESETSAMHEPTEGHPRGSRPLGVEAVLAMDPLHIPDEKREKSGTPLAFASTRQLVLEIRAVLVAITMAFREAAERLRRGDHGVEFPENTFPPSRAIRLCPVPAAPS